MLKLLTMGHGTNFNSTVLSHGNPIPNRKELTAPVIWTMCMNQPVTQIKVLKNWLCA